MKPKVIYEFGATHGGLIEAKELALRAKQSGADYAKVQLILSPDDVVHDKELTFTFQDYRGYDVNLPLWDIINERSMPDNEWREFFSYCDEIGIDVISSVEDKKGIVILEEMGVKAVKVASSDIRNFGLLGYINNSSIKEIHLDAGNASIEDVIKADNLLAYPVSKTVVVHYCPKGYPCPPDLTHLRTISYLREMLPGWTKVGFSDHCAHFSDSMMQAAMAVSLGATYLEKCISLDRKRQLPEFAQSLEYREHMSKYVEAVSSAYTMLGDVNMVVDEKKVSEHDRGTYLTRSVEKGETLTRDMVEFKRPLSVGVSVGDFEIMEGQYKFSRSIPAGQLVKSSYLEK